MKPNRRSLIRIAHSRPETRDALLPLIKELSKTAARPAQIDIDIEPEVGMVFKLRDNGEPFEGDTTEFLYWIETPDGLGEGSLIMGAPSPFKRGDRVTVEKTQARARGGSWVGDVTVRKL